MPFAFFFVSCRIPGSRPSGPGPRHPVRGVPEQEMGVQLERERAGTDHVQVLGTVRRPQEVAHCQRGIVPVQEHVPVGEYLLYGICMTYVFISDVRHWFSSSRLTLGPWKTSYAGI